MREDLVKPTIHLNGTSREELQRQFQDAYAALGAAKAFLIAMNPNDRDYYPQGFEAGRTARAQNNERILAIENIMDEIDVLFSATEKTR